MPVTIKKGPKPPLLTPTEDSVLNSLLVGKTKKEAAAIAKVHPQRVSEMLRREHFVEAYKECRGRLKERAMSRLTHMVDKAIDVILQKLECGETAVELKAAMYVLDRTALTEKAMQDVVIAPLEDPSENEDTVEYAMRIQQNLNEAVKEYVEHAEKYGISPYCETYVSKLKRMAEINSQQEEHAEQVD